MTTTSKPRRHTFPHRGFLPWRLSDAGLRSSRHHHQRPASETLHRSRHRDDQRCRLILKFVSAQRPAATAAAARAANLRRASLSSAF